MKTKQRLTYDQKRDRKTRGTETLGQYIPVYRWLISFIKIAKELEKKKYVIEHNKKKYPVKINRNCNMFQHIDLKLFPDSLKLLDSQKQLQGITYRIKLLETKYGLFRKLREHFILPEIKYLKDNQTVDRNKYDVVTIAVPKNKGKDNILRELRKSLETQIETLSVKRKVVEIKENVPIRFVRDDALKRIFYTFLIKYFNPKISPVELYVQVRKRVFNETVDIKTTFGKKTSGYNYLDYDVQIKNCLRDVKWGKFLILNLCKGHFVEMKNLLK